MQLKFFDIPVHCADEASEALNRFLRAHRIINVDKQFLPSGMSGSWAICVSYVDGGERPASSRSAKVDYRAVLSKEDFALFSRLRELRKRLAAEDGVPIYAVFTNEQLAAMARNRTDSLDELAAIDGVGKARVERHGEAFLALIREQPPPLKQPQLTGDLHGA